MKSVDSKSGAEHEATEPQARGSFRRLLSYTRSAWRSLTLLCLSLIASSLLELAVPWVIGFMLVDRVIKRGQLRDLPNVVMLLAVIFIAQQLFSFLEEYIQELANQKIIHRLRCDLYEHIERLPLKFFERDRTGDMLARITGDVGVVEGLLKTLVNDIASEVISLIGTIGFLWAVNPELTLFVLPTLPALAFSVFFFKRTMKNYARRVRDIIGEMAGLAGETIAGMRVVKAFGGERFEADRFSSKSLQALSASVRTAKLHAFYSIVVEACVFAGTIIVVLIAAPRVVAGAMTIGAFVAYLTYLNKLYSPAKKLSKVSFSVQKILASADRVFEVMDRPLEVQLAQAETQSHKTITTSELKGAVRFEGVTFGYDPERPVLKDFNLDVAPGESIALVGHSGGGKSTVVNLLLRFYLPTAGQIYVDGEPLEHYKIEELRRHISVVPQDVFLFSGTIRDNIAYANPQATAQEIEEAARAAYAHEFIKAFPDGYDTLVGERGTKLSGGQRQRLAIARAVLRNPSILILDEATSHLDSESESLVQDALAHLARGRTVFFIAHRLSTIWHADKIVVIENGEIAESGRHEELLASGGVYRRLYDLQLSPGENQTDLAPALQSTSAR